MNEDTHKWPKEDRHKGTKGQRVREGFFCFVPAVSVGKSWPKDTRS
jgi:hypothetical protein